MQQELKNESLFSHIQGCMLEFGYPCSFSYLTLNARIFEESILKALWAHLFMILLIMAD